MGDLIQTRRAVVVTLLAGCVAPAAMAGAPPWCRADLLQSARAGTRYAVRGNGRYCEGTVAAEHSGLIAFIGLHRGAIAEAPGTHMLQLHARDPLPSGSAPGPLALQAVEISGARSYRLDAGLGPGGLAIDTDAVVRRLNIPVEDLAFLAWTEAGAERVYVPVAASPTATAPTVEAILVSPVPLKRVRARLVDAPSSRDVVLDEPAERTAIRIPLDLGAAARRGPLRVEAFSYNSSDVEPHTFEIALPAR